jgi:hypothetical protein
MRDSYPARFGAGANVALLSRMVARRFVPLAFASALVSSCILPIHHLGSVTLAWSVGDTDASDRSSCTDRSATAVHVVIRQDVGDLVVDASAPCDSFRARYFLDRGWYDASLTLVGAQGTAVSETQRTNAFYVAPRTDTFVQIAFETPPVPR